MKEIKINNVKVNSRDELTFKITVKQSDYSLIELQLLKNSENNGDYLDIEFTWLTSGDKEKEKNNKLVKLNWLMLVYCEKSNNKLETEKENLYRRNKVSSRKELSETQLESEIEMYKVWILEYN